MGFFINPVHSQYNFDVENIPDSLTSSANSVIRHSHVILEMHEDKMTYEYDYAITALNKKHEDKLLFVEHFHKEESKVKNVKITIYDAKGNLVKKIKKKEIKEYGLQNIEFADDTRSIIYGHQSPVFPVTMHVTYKHEIESPYYVHTWYPVDEFKQAVQLASIRITDHVGESFNFQAHDLSEPKTLGHSSLYYEYARQKGFTKEKYMPSLRECLPRLEIALKRLKYFEHVGRINDWNEFGAWIYNEMFVPKQNMDLGILRQETSDLVNDTDSDLEKAQKLFKYIQETTRYILIALQDGGWSPLSTSTVHNKKYGDCKALSFYYNTLCKAHGINTTLALVNAGDEKQSANEDFFSSIQFNHVISKLDIEGKTYWVDCTSKNDPFNYLGKFTDDRNVLLIQEDQGKITKTPEYKNIKTTRSSLTFSEDGNLEGTIDYSTEGIGISSKLYSLPKLSAQEKTVYQKEKLAKYSNAVISEYSYELDTSNLDFKEHFKINCKGEGEKLGKHFKIKVDRNELVLPKFKRGKNRDWPIHFLRSEEYDATTKLKHDLSLVPIIEDDVVLDAEFGKYVFSTTASAGEILIKRNLKINKAKYSSGRYKEIKAFFNKIKKIEKRSIILSSKS